ncbi:MAG: alkaline phosphatase [Thermodesulfovibrionales bacterium]
MNNKGISRRDVLKLAGAGALYSLLPSNVLGSSSPEFSPSKGLGLIFVVGDGMPLGVIRAMHEISTKVWGNSETNLYSLMADARSSVGYMGTKSLSSIVTDSAPASVTWATGSKTANRMLSSLPDERPLKTIMELLKERGYACGLVTTTRVTHATPAAWISHQMNRDAEDDIALDYLKFKPEVLVGGGSRHFDPSKRKDGKDLFSSFVDVGYDVVEDKNSLISKETISSKKPLLGLFNQSHISYYVDRLNNPALSSKQPTLAEMTRVALSKLSKNPRGFILQVEAGRIDHANHSNDAWAAIMDTYELDMTLGVINEYLKVNPNTLVIVTSDHGNSGWGINGTGPDYNDATEALKKYTAIKASFEVIKKEIKGKTAEEIRDIFEHYTTYTLSDREAAMVHESMQPGYEPYPGDFVYQPDAILGKALAHNIYGKDEKGKTKRPAILRRGNVGFTSTNHTAEDQILLAYGYKAKHLGLDRHVDNTCLFQAMCKYFGIKYKNPAMTEEDAKSFMKVASIEEWTRHMDLHIS